MYPLVNYLGIQSGSFALASALNEVESLPQSPMKLSTPPRFFAGLPFKQGSFRKETQCQFWGIHCFYRPLKLEISERLSGIYVPVEHF